MNSIRYFLAAFLVVSLPGLFSYWLLIHPFVGFWCGKGLSVTLTVVLTVVFAIMIGLLSFRHYLLSQNYGTKYLLIAVGIVWLVLSGTMRFAIHKRLNVATLLGLPEIAPNRFPRQLITDGIYGRVRHPRYVQLVVALLGYTLIANYLAAYLILALWVAAIYVIVLLEENELRDHFGAAYEDYCRHVPRFIPRLRGGAPLRKRLVASNDCTACREPISQKCGPIFGVLSFAHLGNCWERGCQ